MSDDEELKGREAFERIFGALFTAGGEIAKALPGVEHDMALRGGLAVVLPVMGFAVGRGLHRAFIGRRKAFAQGYVNAFEGDPEKAAAYGDQNKDDDEYHNTMYRAFRLMLDAADPSVIETLGYLAGQYTYAKKAADLYFRHLGRLLCDFEAGDLEVLKTLLHGVVSCEGEGDLVPGIEDVGVRIAQHSGDLVEVLEGQINKEQFKRLGEARSARRVFELLKRETLGKAMGGGFWRQWNKLQSSETNIMVDFAMAKKMLEIVDPHPVR